MIYDKFDYPVQSAKFDVNTWKLTFASNSLATLAVVENCKLTLPTNFTTSLYHFHLLYTSTPIRRLVLPCFIRCPAYYVAAAFVVGPILINNRHTMGEFDETRARINLTLRKSGGVTFRVHGLLKTSTVCSCQGVIIAGNPLIRQVVGCRESRSRRGKISSVRFKMGSVQVPCFSFEIKIRDDLSR